MARLMLLLLLLPGCANYQLKNNLTTTTINTDGTKVIQAKVCELSISSAREVKAGDIKISKSCALTGGAESLGASQAVLELMGAIVRKVP